MYPHTHTPTSLSFTSAFTNMHASTHPHRCSARGPGGDSDRAAAGREDSGPEGGGGSGAAGETEQGPEDPTGGDGGSSEGQTQAQRRRPGGQDRLDGGAAGTGETVRETHRSYA